MPLLWLGTTSLATLCSTAVCNLNLHLLVGLSSTDHARQIGTSNTLLPWCSRNKYGPPLLQFYEVRMQAGWLVGCAS